MDVRVLGPLEVLDDAGSPIALGGPKQRALLALLLASGNEVVSGARLLDELWGEEPPGSGLSALHVRVAQLRRVLEQLDPAGGGASMVETRPPGYRLRIRDAELDARRFERLVTVGMDALGRSDPAAAAAGLHDAVAMCRGAPFAGLQVTPSIRAEATRLEELRLTAVEAGVEARLELGRHPALVPDLERLVVQYPTRERLRGQLMRALYRCGRQADALAVYGAGRRLLVETLGIEPGQELRELQVAILHQDATLAPTRAHVTPSLPPERPTPERKIVTILVAEVAPSSDLVGLDAEIAADILEQLIDATAAELTAVGGTVEAGRGDSVMAVFGAPLAHEDHAERALHAALAMRDRITRVLQRGAPRIGVATGEVVMGRAGGAPRLVTGPVIAVSARIQQCAAPAEILVEERTVRVVRGAFEFGARRSVAGNDCRLLVRALSLTRPRGVGGFARRGCTCRHLQRGRRPDHLPCRDADQPIDHRDGS